MTTKYAIRKYTGPFPLPEEINEKNIENFEFMVGGMHDTLKEAQRWQFHGWQYAPLATFVIVETSQDADGFNVPVKYLRDDAAVRRMHERDYTISQEDAAQRLKNYGLL